MPVIEVELGDAGYPVCIGADLLANTPWWSAHLPDGRVLVVSDDRVAPLYLDALLAGLPDRAADSLVLPHGETAKTVENWSRILDRLIALQAGRDACLVALGGGMVGDLGGFAAATYMRGIPFIQVPTTLLAQVDASVGGKTAVNHERGKNLIGAFHQPRAVLADVGTLDTLAEREYGAGLAEVVKYGMIRDAEFLAWLEARPAAILARDPETVTELVTRSIRHKAEVVAADEREAGVRALLNFGHSFGHALETVTAYERFLHGEAVAIGMVVAARLSELRALAPAGTAERLAGLLAGLGLPTRLPAEIPARRIIDCMGLDKKNLGGKQRLILLHAAGKAMIDSDSSIDQITQALEASR